MAAESVAESSAVAVKHVQHTRPPVSISYQ